MPASALPSGPAPARRDASKIGLAVALVGLAISAVLASSTGALYRESEAKVLQLRAHDAASLLTAALPAIATPLALAAGTAAATGGRAQEFTSLLRPYVGTGRTFVAADLLQRRAGLLVVVARIGPPSTTSLTSGGRALVARSLHASVLSVGYLSGPAQPDLGYATTSAGPGARYSVLAQAPLPADRRLRVAKRSAFADLAYTLYLDEPGQAPHLLATSFSNPHIPPPSATERVPFGDATLDLVMRAKGSLVGTFFADFPWIVAGVGILVSLGAAALSERLVRRRRGAEELAQRLDEVAEENQRLYDEQRTIAESLQHALLPDDLPEVPGLEIRVRYVSGSDAIDIGGDWYDVIQLGGDRVLVVVGDVSGRGLRAATIMASLRFSIRAYARQGDEPAAILSKLSDLLDVARDGHYATVVCVVVDAARAEMTFTNAGHLEPLVVSAGGEGEFVSTDLGVPVGVGAGATYGSTTMPVPKGGSLLIFTDGLVERRGEHLDVGMGELRTAATSDCGTLDEMLSTVVQRLLPEGADDDVAMLGLRWKS